MSATQFRDQLAIRYTVNLLGSPYLVKDVARPLAYSRDVIAPSVGWSRKATTTSVTVMH